MFLLGGGGGGAVADAYPLVVVESDTVQVSGLQLVESDAAQVSVLPVAGWKFPAVFLGKVAFDLVGLGDGPPCLLTLTDERAQLARAAPGVTPVDSSETRAPVCELILPSVLSEPLADCLHEPMSGEKNFDYVIRTTHSVWTPSEQVYRMESGDVDFDSFGMAPWDAGGMDSRTLGDPYRTSMLQWLMRLLCRPVIMNGLIQTWTGSTENELDTNMMVPTDSPRLTVTPGEWYGNDVFTQIRHELRDAWDDSAAVNCNAVIRINPISRRLCLLPEEVSAGRYVTDDFPETDCTTAVSDAADMNDLISRRLCLPPEEFSAGLDGTDDFPEMDCAAADNGAVDMSDLNFRQLSLPPSDDYAAVDYDTGVVGLHDLVFFWLSSPPEEFAGEEDPAVDAGDAMMIEDIIVRLTNLPPNGFSTGRNGDYIWLNSGTGLSVCAMPVTGSLPFGHPRGLLSLHRLESAPRTQSCHCQTTIVRVTPESSVFEPWRQIEQPSPSVAASGPLPGTFLGPTLDIRSEYLYELGPDIPDVMGLRALMPDAAAVKVMSVRNNRCNRVVTPDDRGYHEILQVVQLRAGPRGGSSRKPWWPDSGQEPPAPEYGEYGNREVQAGKSV